MCVTLGTARLSSTILYAAEVFHEGRPVHVMGYQNKAHSDGPNAMILPIPARSALGPGNMIDMTEARHVLEEYRRVAQAETATLGMSLLGSVPRAAPQVFNKGSYTVVLAERATDIPAALDRVPANRRIQNPNPAIFEAYEQLYPGWPIAVCCWSGTIQAEPLVWWFESKYTALFLPALDAHDGNPPNLGDHVQMDHYVIHGYPQGKHHMRSRTHVPFKLLNFFPEDFDAFQFRHEDINGDFWFTPSNRHPRRWAPGKVHPEYLR